MSNLAKIENTKFSILFQCGNCGRRFSRPRSSGYPDHPMCSRECWWKSEARKEVTKKNLHTAEVRAKISSSLSGANNIWYGKKGKDAPAWKGSEAGYFAIHRWIRNNFGKAYKCENKSTRKAHLHPKKFEWALIHGEEHGHDRSKYKMLCASCHRLYDGIKPIWAK